MLVADSFAGHILAVDTHTGKSKIALQDASLAANFSAPLPIGVNGLKVHGKYVYYSNTALGLLGRVCVDAVTGTAEGAFEILAKTPEISVPDDFAVGNDGKVFLAGPLPAPLGGTVQRVGKDGKVKTLAEGGDVVGSTGVTFGRGKGKGAVYVGTSQGRVVAIEL